MEALSGWRDDARLTLDYLALETREQKGKSKKETARMLSMESQWKIIQLHNAGLSSRQIEKQIHVSRSTIGKIVRLGRVTPSPAKKSGKTRKIWGRCPSCRCFVLLPCLACSLSRRVIFDPHGLPVDLGLKLEGDDLARYLEIRAAHFAEKKD